MCSRPTVVSRRSAYAASPVRGWPARITYKEAGVEVTSVSASASWRRSHVDNDAPYVNKRTAVDGKFDLTDKAAMDASAPPNECPNAQPSCQPDARRKGFLK
jgi:hypothetical protein